MRKEGGRRRERAKGGAPSSVIRVLSLLQTKLLSLLPRESGSKEVDAGLLTIIGYPAFAVESQDVIHKTHSEILSKLMVSIHILYFLG